MTGADWQVTPLTFPVLLGGLLCAWVAYVSWRRRALPEAVPFTVLMGGIAGWTLLSLVEKSLLLYEPRRIISTLVYVFIVTTPGAWLAFAVCFARLARGWVKRAWPLLVVEPVLVVGLAFTDSYHGLFRAATRMRTDGPYVVMAVSYGPLFWIHAAYTYFLFAAGAGLVGWGAWRRRWPAGRLAVLLAGMLVPALGNVAYVFRLQPERFGDLTPVYFVVSGLAAAWMLFHVRILDIHPIARSFILDCLHDPVFVLDKRHRLLDLNRAAESLLTAPPPRGKAPLATVFPELDPLLGPHAPAELTTESSLRGDGKERFWEVNVRQIVDHQVVLGILVRLSDITDRKRAAEERAELLAREHAARAEAERLLALAHQEGRRKDHFLAVLGHELRTPLATLSNALSVMQRPERNDPAAEQALGRMERQVQQLVRLVDDILDVSRAVRNRMQLRREALDLAWVVARAVETTQPFIDAQRHELTVDFPEPLWVEGDPVRLAQVVANLLRNAAKYTEPGGRIQLTAAREGAEAVLRVRDNGIGITPEALPHIFDLFVQADEARARSQGGLGIGLTLVQRLTEMHGGTVEAFSPGPGQGSEFVVRLPTLGRVRAHGPDRASTKELAAPASPPRRRILVVDDNADSAETLALLLRMEGHEVRVAFDGPTALAAVQVDPPEVVLTDIGMPGMDGYELAERLRKMTGLENLSIVALTGWGGEDDRRRARQAGFDHHLMKPADPEALRRVLAHPLRHGD